MKLSQTAMLRTKRSKGWLCQVLRWAVDNGPRGDQHARNSNAQEHLL